MVVQKLGTQLYINKEDIIKDLEKKSLLGNSSGSALVMVLMATIGLAVLSLVVMNSKKQTNTIAQRFSADRDIERIMARIASLVVNPADCNANFKSKSFTSPASTPFTTTLNKCQGGTCNGSGSVVPVMNINNWVVFVDEPISATQKNGRIRISSVTYALTQQQSTKALGPRHLAGTSASFPAILTLTVSFERFVGMGAGGSQIITKISRVQPYTVDAFVVTSTSTQNANGIPADVITDNPSGLILGCPSSPSSTYPYQ